MAQMVAYAKNEGYTSLLVVNEDKKKVNGLTIINLPDGPSAQFRLTRLVMNKEIKVYPFLKSFLMKEKKLTG